MSRQESIKYLVAKAYDLAIPGAVMALKFCKEIYGDSSVEVVRCYLLLAESNLGFVLNTHPFSAL